MEHDKNWIRVNDCGKIKVRKPPTFCTDQLEPSSSKPPISWLQKPKPLSIRESPPLRFRPWKYTGWLNLRPSVLEIFVRLVLHFVQKEQLRFLLFFFQKLKYALVIKIRVIIMHFSGSEPSNHFTLVGTRSPKSVLKQSTPHIQKCFQLTLVPACMHLIGKSLPVPYQLPHIPLPNSSIVFHQKIAPFSMASPNRGDFLCNIGIDPNTDF